VTRFLIIAAALLLASCQMPLRNAAAQQTIVRDAGGRTIGTASTDSQGTTTFRDSRGSTTGTATHSDQGSAGSTTTFRDAGGRTTGSASTPWRK
jgi:hypothetical protein